MACKIFIVILNWNRAKDTIECLESISRLKTTNYILDVLIVDNGSKDNSVALIRKLHIPGFKFQLIENKENLGFSGGNNVGIKYAIEKGADFILILNNDTVVDKDSVNEFLKATVEQENFGILSPKIYFAKGYEFHKARYKNSDLGKVVWSAGGDIDWKNVYASNHGVDEVDKGQFNKVREIDFASGACMFLNVKALESTGMFDEKYYMYLEDADLSMRMKKKGWKVLYIPSTVLWHKVAQSSAIGSGLNDYYITRNRLIFGNKYASLRARLALIRESFRFMFSGRKWQRKGVIDFYLRKLGKGSWVA